jgi:hypothetical protein
MLTEEPKRCGVFECTRKYYAKNYCKLHYRRNSKHNNPNIVLKSHHSHESKVHLMKLRFETKFIKTAENECWLWSGAKSYQGYGVFNLHIGKCKYKKVIASRLSYEFYNGQIPIDMFVCHSCDNPICVNPNHLFLGTQKDNLKDMSLKGRSLWGEKNVKAKFTNIQANEIRQKLNEKLCSMSSLAKELNVHLCTIKRIKYNKSYVDKDIYANI